MLASRLAVVVALTALGSGCASKPPLAMRAPDATVSTWRMAILEANVLVYQLGENTAYPRQEWTAAAQKNIDAALWARARHNTVGVIDPKGFDEREYALLSSWADRTLDQIDARAEGHAFLDVGSVIQWRYDRSLEPWRAVLGGADHVLVTRFRDAYTTDGQAISDIVSGIHWNVRPQSIACAASLKSGRIVWCARETSRRWDLRSPPSAKAVVDRLVAEVLPR